ncbi:TetR/AcrR family transcriptional regulator [Streptomyces sp. NPDC048527]|uniref:TetR/AcrR family transcriptional regulator n=1 Tax=Streptomyces sp. NPDC048527 TaxID=3365568 RepID=UPI003710FC17
MAHQQANRNGAKRRPRDRRAVIEAAAAGLFATRGFSGASISDIASQVGVTPGAIYRHFPSKDALLRTILLDCLDQVSRCAEAIPAPMPPAERLRVMVRRTMDLALGRPAWLTTYLTERHRLTAADRDQLRAAARRIATSWSTAILACNPWLSHSETLQRQRQRSVNGVLMMLARRNPGSHGPRTARLVEDAVMRLLLAAPYRGGQLPDPGLPSPPWRPPHSRRRQIRDAALTLFRAQGYSGVGIDEIGRAAGIAGPTVYGSYASKAEILADACDFAVSRLEVAVDKAMEEAESAPHALRLLVQAYAQVAFATPDITTDYARDAHALPPTDRARVARRLADIRLVSAEILCQVCPGLEVAEAHCLFAAAGSAAREAALGKDGTQMPPAATPELLLEFLLPRAGASTCRPPAS